MPNDAAAGIKRDDLDRYRQASRALETTQSEIEELEHSAAFEVFQKQLGLLRKRLLNDPQSLRQVFIDDGTQAIVWEFKQDKLGGNFTKTLWNLLLRDDDMSSILLRFIWNVPLKFKRKFIAAIDAHLSDRYPMFKGLSQGWPAQNSIPPYIRPPEVRAKDFELVNQGYLGYMSLGYSAREVELLVWLEALRDKQCEDRPCEIGVPKPGAEPKGGCPVKIHIPEMLELLGTGRFREALELIETCNPLPNVTGRVCPQELQCQGVCTHQAADRDRPDRMVPAAARAAGQPEGRRRAFRRAYAESVGEGRQAAGRGGRLRSRRADQRLPAGGRGLPGDDVRGVPRARRRAALRHPRVPAAQRR